MVLLSEDPGRNNCTVLDRQGQVCNQKTLTFEGNTRREILFGRVVTDEVIKGEILTGERFTREDRTSQDSKCQLVETLSRLIGA